MIKELLFFLAVGAGGLMQTRAEEIVTSASCQDISGRLPFAVTPASDASQYDQSRTQYASNMASYEISDKVLSPDVIAFCSNDNDVLQAIKFGKECGYKISIRSGGHQYAGFSSCAAYVDGPSCMQIDTSALESYNYDEAKNELTLGSGLDVQQVHSILLPLGLAVPMGVCNSVNVGGHFQSSAAGFLARTLGLGLDHVVSFRIALANEAIITAKQGDDLYWAALGGSPGSWGVVLDYTIKPVKDTDYPNSAIAIMDFPYSKENFLNLGRQFMTLQRDPDAVRDLSVSFFISPTTQDRLNEDFTHRISFQIFWSGVDNGPLIINDGNGNYLKYIQPLLEIAEPLLFIGPIQVSLSVAAATLTTNFDQAPNARYHVHSMSMPEFPDDSFFDMYANELEARMQPNSGIMHSSLQFIPLGGPGGSQFNDNVGSNAYPTRDTMLHVDDWVFFEDENEELAKDRVKNIREVTTEHWKVKGSADNSFMTTTSLVPYDAYTRGMKRWEDLKDYFPSDEWLNKLVNIKRFVDEDDLFHSVLTIPLSTKKGKSSKSN